jgi:hypothetical protein
MRAMRTVVVGSAIVASLFIGCGGDGGGQIPQTPTDPAPASTGGASTGAASTSGNETGGGNQDHTGGGDARTTTPNPTPGTFGATCSSDSDCDSVVCYQGGNGGFCSQHCTEDAQCPTPFSGAPHCNPHDYCRY